MVTTRKIAALVRGAVTACGTGRKFSVASRDVIGLDSSTCAARVSRDVPLTTEPGKALISGPSSDFNRGKGPILRGLAARAPYFLLAAYVGVHHTPVGVLLSLCVSVFGTGKREPNLGGKS